MSAAIEEWSRRRGRIKLAQLVTEAVAATMSELGAGTDTLD